MAVVAGGLRRSFVPMWSYNSLVLRLDWGVPLALMGAGILCFSPWIARRICRE
jgi:hypothetical protein